MNTRGMREITRHENEADTLVLWLLSRVYVIIMNRFLFFLEIRKFDIERLTLKTRDEIIKANNKWISKASETEADNNAVPLPREGSHTGVTKINNCNLLKRLRYTLLLVCQRTINLKHRRETRCLE